MTSNQRDLDYQNMSNEDWKRKWMSKDGGYIVPKEDRIAIRRFLRNIKEY